MKHFKAIIFDMDGLLLDTERMALSAFLETCRHFGLPLREELFICCIGTNESRGRELLKAGLRGPGGSFSISQNVGPFSQTHCA